MVLRIEINDGWKNKKRVGNAFAADGLVWTSHHILNPDYRTQFDNGTSIFNASVIRSRLLGSDRNVLRFLAPRARNTDYAFAPDPGFASPHYQIIDEIDVSRDYSGYIRSLVPCRQNTECRISLREFIFNDSPDTSWQLLLETPDIIRGRSGSPVIIDLPAVFGPRYFRQSVSRICGIVSASINQHALGVAYPLDRKTLYAAKKLFQS